MPRIVIVSIIACIALSSPTAPDTLKVMRAGSLRAALTDLLHRFPAWAATIAEPEFNSSGLLCQKLESGAQADVFTSADMEQPRRLATDHPERMVIHFTHNSLCAVARPGVGLTTDNMLDR